MPSFSRLRAHLSLAALLTLTPLAALAQGGDHTYTSADIETGSRIYASQCSLCHGPNGDLVSGVNLRRSVFRRVVSDSDLRNVITNGITGSGMPPFNFQPEQLSGIVAFIRAGFDPAGTAARVGEPLAGRTVFEGKGGCLSCHRVNATGSRTGPDLSEIGLIRQPSALHRSLLEPTAGMLPINRPVRIVTAEGRTLRGRRVNEDTYTVQIADEEGRLHSLDKATLRAFEIGSTSPMPSYAGVLTADEVAHVIAYLLSLRGVQ